MRALSRPTILTFLLSVLFAFHSTAQPAPSPIISPTLNEAAAEPLTAKGLALLDKATWRQTSSQNKVQLSILKDTLICQISIRNRVCNALDAKTGKILWSPDPKQILSIPQDATESAFLFFEETLESLSFLGIDANTAARTDIWTWKTPVVPPRTLFRIFPIAILAGDRVIVGANTIVNGGGSILGMQRQTIEIRALDRKTGDELWITPLPDQALSAFASFHNGTIFLQVKQSVDQLGQNAKSRIVAMDHANGKILWSTPRIDSLLLSPAFLGNTVVSENENGEVFARDAKTGNPIWRKTISPDCDPAKSKIAATNVSAGRLFIDGTTVYTPANSKLNEPTLPANADKVDLTIGAFAAFDLETGQQTGYFGGIKRQFQLPRNGSANYTQSTKGAIEILGIKNALIYAKTPDTLLAIDQKTFKPLWRIPAVGAVIDENTLYLNTTRVTEETIRDRQSEIFAIPLSAIESAK